MRTLGECAGWLAGWTLLVAVVAVFVLLWRISWSELGESRRLAQHRRAHHNDPRCGACRTGATGRR